jgi:flagellin-like hook-associated protein FlgL
MDRTTERLSTGKKVNSALDDPVAYFTAKSHTDRANDLQVLKDNMSEGIQTIESVNSGIEAIQDLVDQADSIITSAKTADAGDLAGLQDQWTEIMTQIDDLATDAVYKGVNLLAGDTLTVKFEGSHKLDVVGFDASNSGLGFTAAADFSSSAELETHAAEVEAALSSLRTNAQTLSSNLSIVNTREDFTTNMINNLLTGADNLTLTDMNEEAANELALETRQSLGITSLSMASNAAQSVLQLFQ